MPLANYHIMLDELGNLEDLQNEAIYRVMEYACEEGEGKDDYSLGELSQVIPLVKQCFGEHIPTVEKALEELENVFTSGHYTSLERRWAKRTIDRIRYISPISAKVTFKAVQEAKHKDLGECYRTDYRIAKRMLVRKRPKKLISFVIFSPPNEIFFFFFFLFVCLFV